MNNSGFYKISLSFENNLFDKLSHSVNFENITKGRIGNHLVYLKNETVPIVRTTTIYNIPAHNFSSIHHQIIESLNTEIQNSSLDYLSFLDFNNALIEVYDSNYATMKYHSDQAMDLEADSYIGLFTCYEKPNELTEKNIRKLKIKDKFTDEEFDIPLTHNSIVLFSLFTNTKYLHKIVLESIPGQKKSGEDNKWMGITFRKSKTFIQFKNNMPYFPDGELLTLADEDEKKEFFKLRSEENNNMNFEYPKLKYTLSVGDTIIPER
ncbi:hypothetical protein [Flavobacterium ajazii]|uniref:hypothetical protein n=1 Tax=Flavobacterium ajazii TaxID=2692318 RepID=UPI0013D2FE5B|nr:hypothetical protein [Flavobacterium ajazii]